jgi:glucose-6-phosphate 1-dehydrogenase
VIDDKPKAGERPGDPCTIVIFGAGGDLTRRKLLPALYNLRRYGLLPKDFAIIGVGRKEMKREDFVARMGSDLKEFATAEVEAGAWDDLGSRLYYVGFDFEQSVGYGWLGDVLKDVETRHKTAGNVLFYLATPPTVFSTIVKGCAGAGLTDETGRWRRFIVEKPFGHDLDSAKALNRDLLSSLSESQIYRIDHYLGKETVQNILAFRFANGIFEPVWNRRYIDHVQITVAETLGVEGRGGYYDSAGVLRDMIQNHMFQLLSLVAMEPPWSFDAGPVRDEKVKVLNAIRPMQPEEILQRTVRGQYGEGFVDGQKLVAYRAEPSVAAKSATETYGALKLDVENWRWAGVPFYLRSGKRLAKHVTEIVIQFRKPPLLAFGKIQIQDLEPNRLILSIQPEEGITIEIKAKRPGATMNLTQVNLDFNYSDFGPSDKATGYERLLYDAMIGDTTLYHRADTVEAAWRIATPILDVWGSIPPRDFPNYGAATWGPSAADDLLKRDGRAWRNI